MRARRWVSPNAIVVVFLAAVTRLSGLENFLPGIQYDTASKGVQVLQLLFAGHFPFYINHMGAPEPLIIYLQSLSVALFGVNAFALRFVTAVAGILAVTFLYRLTRECLRDERAALIAAFAFAVAIEPIHLARTGLRVALVPLIEIALIFFFWRAWRHPARRDFVIAGVLLGISVYTYLAALALPVVILALLAHQIIFARDTWRAQWRHLIALFGMAALIALPRVAFQIAFPAASLARVAQVSLLQNPDVASIGVAGVVTARLVDYVKMLGITWQGELFNPLRLPLLDPFLFLLFIVGLMVCLAGERRLEMIWAPVTLALMLVPDLLGANDPSPSEVRTIGIPAPTFFLVGIGAAAMISFLQTRAPRRFVQIAFALVLALGAAIGLHAYFVEYAARVQAGADQDFNRTDVVVSKWINAQSDSIYLPLNEFARATTHYLVGARAPRVRAGSFVPAHAWVVIPNEMNRPRTEGRVYAHDPVAYVLIADGAVTVLPPLTADQPALEERLGVRAPDAAIRNARGEIIARAYRLDASSLKFVAPRAQAGLAHFTRGVDLLDALIEKKRVQPGESIPLALFWQTRVQTVDDRVIFVHLLDAKEKVISTADVFPALGAFPTFLWQPGERVPTHHQLPVPLRTPPGKYWIEVGMYNALDQTRLELQDLSGESRVIVGAVKIAPRQPLVYNPANLQRGEFETLALVGYDVMTTVNPREFRVATYWHARAAMPSDYSLFVHALDARGEIIAQADHSPQSGNYPTSIWDVGEIVRDEFSITLPPGKFTLMLGWYDLKTGARLARRDAPGDSLILDTVLEAR